MKTTKARERELAVIAAVEDWYAEVQWIKEGETELVRRGRELIADVRGKRAAVLVAAKVLFEGKP